MILTEKKVNLKKSEPQHIMQQCGHKDGWMDGWGLTAF